MRQYMEVNGVKLHYVESGKEAGPLVLFLHGFPEFWYSWRHQISHFQKVTIRPIP
jgi:pimeloyl-ACP methyl ester carboxylesterase